MNQRVSWETLELQGLLSSLSRWLQGQPARWLCVDSAVKEALCMFDVSSLLHSPSFLTSLTSVLFRVNSVLDSE